MSVNLAAVKQPENNFAQRATQRIHQGNAWKWADLKGNFGKITKDSLVSRVNAFALAVINTAISAGVAAVLVPVTALLATTVKIPTYFANKVVRVFSQDGALARFTKNVDDKIPSIFTLINLVKLAIEGVFSAASHVAFGVFASPTINENIQTDLNFERIYSKLQKAEKAPEENKEVEVVLEEEEEATVVPKEKEEAPAPAKDEAATAAPAAAAAAAAPAAEEAAAKVEPAARLISASVMADTKKGTVTKKETEANAEPAPAPAKV